MQFWFDLSVEEPIEALVPEEPVVETTKVEGEETKKEGPDEVCTTVHLCESSMTSFDSEIPLYALL